MKKYFFEKRFGWIKGDYMNELLFFIVGIIILLLSIIYIKPPFVYFLIVIAILLMIFNPLYRVIYTFYLVKRYETMFPNFIQNVVGGVKSGMPLPRAVMHASQADYKELNVLIKELSNKIEWGISFKKALLIFAKKSHSRMIKKVVFTVIEAEKSGANVEDVLSAVTESLTKLKHLEQKKRANIYNRTVQAYIIYIVFIAIMIIVQNVLIPTMVDIQTVENPVIRVTLGTLIKDVSINTQSFNTLISSLMNYLMTLKGIILAIIIIQGFFMGLTLGKLSEGSTKAGIKHSLILMIIGFIIIVLFQ